MCASSVFLWLGQFAAFLLCTMALQYQSGAWRAELSGYPDEPAHFVSGVLVRDYLADFPPRPILPYAREFYIHYPKVAIGHWPPLFYGIEGIWFLLFGVSRFSALM